MRYQPWHRVRHPLYLTARFMNAPQGRGVFGGLPPQGAPASSRTRLASAAIVAVRARAPSLAGVTRPSRWLPMASMTTLSRGKRATKCNTREYIEARTTCQTARLHPVPVRSSSVPTGGKDVLARFAEGMPQPLGQRLALGLGQATVRGNRLGEILAGVVEVQNLHQLGGRNLHQARQTLGTVPNPLRSIRDELDHLG